MSTETIVVLVVLALLIGSLPNWSYSQNWGYGPSGLFTILGVILLLWLFFGSDSRHIGRGTGGDYSKPAGHSDLKDAAQEVGDGLKDAGHEMKRAVQDVGR
jgi:hypothetical protein